MIADALAISELRILWVDDDSGWIDGFSGELREEGHFVLLVDSIDEAEELVRVHAFDLLILDQKIGSADTGGTTLVRRLTEGMLGELNRYANFMFFTGSNEWVTTADVDVESLDGCLGIEEKGEVFTDFIGDYLARTTPNSNRTEDHHFAGEQPPSQGRSTTVRKEIWQGTVTAVEQTNFCARLSRTDETAPEYDAEMAISRVPDGARQYLAVGATLLLRVEALDYGNRRTIRSELTLFPAPRIDKAQLVEALERARQRRGET